MTDTQPPAGRSPPGGGADPLMDVVARLGEGLRAWSLAMSFLGDCIVPRGGEVGIATIAELLAVFGVDNGVTRTSMSRLAGDGWVTRQKVGRKSFYALTPPALAASQAAARRIYAPRHPERPCNWRIVYAGGLAKEEQARLRAELRRRGSAELASQTYLLPDGPDVSEIQGAIAMTATSLPDADARLLVARAFDLVALGEDYEKFVAAFAPVREDLEAGGKFAGLEALAMRTLVIHAFRRIVLRDPMIPAP